MLRLCTRVRRSLIFFLFALKTKSDDDDEVNSVLDVADILLQSKQEGRGGERASARREQGNFSLLHLSSPAALLESLIVCRFSSPPDHHSVMTQ